MSFKDQVVELIIKGRDLFSSEAEKSEKALAGLAQQSEVLNDRLEELEDLHKAADGIEGLTRSIAKGEQAYKDNSVALDKLVTEQKQAVAAAKKLDVAHQQSTQQTEILEQQYKKNQAQLVGYEQQLSTAKEKVEKLSAEQGKGTAATKEQAVALDKACTELQQLEQSQASAEISSKELAVALDTQRRELLEISSAADLAGQKKAEYTLKVKQSRAELNKLASSIGKSKTELEKQTSKLSKAGYAMDKLADASRDLERQQVAAKTAINSTNNKLARHEKLLKTSSKTAKEFGGSIGSATQNLFAMAGAYIGVDRLWESLKGILTSGDRFEAFSLQMTAMMGSIAGGEQATTWIKEFSNNTGTKLDSVKDAFVKLKAFGIDPMNGSLLSMVDYNAKLGGSQEKLEGIILAVGQAWAKQKLQGEEILQLVERGVPVWELLEKVTGKNVVQLQKLSEKGQLGRDTIKALYEELGKQANGHASKSLDRLAGQINLIANKFEEFKIIVADSGVYQVAVDLLKDLNQQFDDLNKQGKIKAAAEDISRFFSGMIRDSGSSLRQTLNNITAFTTALNAISGGIRLIWNGLSAGVSTLAASVTESLAVMLDGYAKLYEFIGADNLAESVRDTAATLHAISSAYVAQIEQDGKDVRAAWLQITGEVAQAATTAYNKISSTAKKSANDQVGATKEVTKAQSDQAKKAKELELAMSKAGITTVNVLREQAEQAKKTFAAVKQGVKDGTAGTFELEQAFLKYADAQIKAAEAGDEHIHASIRQQAAALGLSKNVNELIKNYQQLGDIQQNLGEQTNDAADSVKKGSSVIGTTLSNTMDTVVKSAEQAGSGLASVAAYFASIGSAIAADVAALSKGTTAYFESMVHGVQRFVDESSDLEKAQNEFDRLGEVIRELDLTLASTIDFVGLRTWALETERSGKIAQRAYYEQRVEMLRLVDSLEAADGANEDLIRSASVMSETMGLLNDQDLSHLEGAIDSARARMDDLRSSAADTLTSLQDELDEFEGRQQDIERRRYESQLAEIRAQLEVATRRGDDDLIARLQESERLLSRVYQYRTDEVKAQQESDKATTNQTRTEQTTTQNNNAQQQLLDSIQLPSLNFDSLTRSQGAPLAVFQLQVGGTTLSAVTRRSLLEDLMVEINRQQSLGG